MSKHPASARRTAVYALDQILGQGRLMSELIGEKAFTILSAPERATAQRLTLDVLRGMDRADRLLNRHLRKTPQLHVMNVLRLGTVEMAHGGDAHGVVNELVAMVASHRRYGHLKGMVNAVLRKMADGGTKSWNDLRVPRLPDWIREPLKEAYGGGVINDIEKTHLAGAALDITSKANAETWAEKLGGSVLPTGTIRISGQVQVSALPGYKDGEWWVQDVAAALPARILDPKPGEKVLDLCAAPGGKTMQIAAAGAEVTAVDVSERRIERLQDNLKRTGLDATCISGDALSHSGGPYDAILLDAPCSATGTIRRHPDLPYAKDGSEFGALIELQAQMLNKALTLLKPGGRLVYCTCSLLPDEGECQIEDVLETHPDVKIDVDALKRPGVSEDWITEEGGLRLRPDFWSELGGMDGFYIACLQT